jgi:hypothetical protein
MTQQINLKRGTNTARLTTLGTPSQGEPIYCTDTKALFIGDGSTAGAVPASKPSSVIQLTSSLTTDINASATGNLVGWDNQDTTWGVDFSHSTSSNNSRITFRYTGFYEISATVAVNAASSIAQRYNGFLRARLGGSTMFGPTSCCAYIRDATAHDNATFHLPAFVYSATGGTYMELTIDRETSVTAAVNLTANLSYLYIKRIG